MITLNNPDVLEEAKDYIEAWHRVGKARYACGQLERGAEGTVHIQAFVNFEKP